MSPIAAKKVPNVDFVQYVGTSQDGHAVQLLAEASIAGFSPGPSLDVVNGLHAAFAKAGVPAGLELHLAGTVATNVAQQQQSKTAGNRTQLLTILFIIVLLLFVFRSVIAPIVTLLPAAVVLQVSGALIGELGSHGLKISQITQLLLIVLILGAGTDYGLFLVFRVREGIRSGLAPNDAVARAVARVGESISASAGTVILALLTLLFASFGIYHDLGVPLAIGIAVMLLAGLTLLPALLAILGRVAFWPAKIAAGERERELVGQSCPAGGRTPRQDSRRRRPRLRRSRVGIDVLHAGRVSAEPPTAPSGSDAAAGNAALAKYFPQASSNPTNLILKLAVARRGRTRGPSSRQRASCRQAACSRACRDRSTRQARPSRRPPTFAFTTRSEIRSCCRHCRPSARRARGCRARCTTRIARRRVS